MRLPGDPTWSPLGVGGGLSRPSPASAVPHARVLCHPPRCPRSVVRPHGSWKVNTHFVQTQAQRTEGGSWVQPAGFRRKSSQPGCETRSPEDQVPRAQCAAGSSSPPTCPPACCGPPGHKQGAAAPEPRPGLNVGQRHSLGPGREGSRDVPVPWLTARVSALPTSEADPGRKLPVSEPGHSPTPAALPRGADGPGTRPAARCPLGLRLTVHGGLGHSGHTAVVPGCGLS